jgi:hypothetical protein
MSPEAREHSFDELTRGLASGSISRGKALRLMGAALVGGVLASIPGVAMAKPKPAGRKCNHNHQCESGNCVDGECSPCPFGTDRLSNGTCAKPCTASGGECAAGCSCALHVSRATSYCTTGVSSRFCSSDSQCPPGEFCTFFPAIGSCVAVC